MPTFFTPPVAPTVPTVAHAGHPGTQLFRHYRPWDAGINVFLLDDGSVTQAEPYANAGVRRVFHGGHIHPVDAAEAALLTAAGYTVLTVPDEPRQPGLPGFDDLTSGEAVDLYPAFYSDTYGIGQQPGLPSGRSDTDPNANDFVALYEGTYT